MGCLPPFICPNVLEVNALSQEIIREQLGGVAYRAYVASVGGVSVKGEVLPTWNHLRDDPTKADVVKAWCDAAIAVGQHTTAPLRRLEFVTHFGHVEP